MMKLLKHLTNAPVAVALAFLLVGAPAAPVAKMLPSSGVARAHNCTMSHGEYIREIINQQIMQMSGGGVSGDYGPQNGNGQPLHIEPFVDTDCDGIPDDADKCPNDATNSCGYTWRVAFCHFVDWYAAIGLAYGGIGLIIPEPVISKFLSVYGFVTGGTSFVLDKVLC